MRRNQLRAVVAVFATSALVITGCKGTGKKPAPPQAGQMGGEVGGVPVVGPGGDIGVSGRPAEGAGWDRAQLQAQTVYFDFDSARVRPDEIGKLQAVAAVLKNGSQKLIIEGHADERGTSEYNRALAERRALACREELTRLGVSADRVSTISYGEERPADTGHHEAAWSKNRRCEFVIVAQ